MGFWVRFSKVMTIKRSEFSTTLHFLVEVDSVYTDCPPRVCQLGKLGQERKLQLYHTADQHPLSRPTGHSANGLLYFIIK